ncbi:hypothetical protein HNP82_000204 [Catenibacillus scindens]|uniref:Uncharacterized protein n=1 Tax=Catenibacillus scindens TaxID=673271 RepID=A0A7W8M3J2_9FIRM|nr:hypothetical protein [Catenibacillus scindens]
MEALAFKAYGVNADMDQQTGAALIRLIN